MPSFHSLETTGYPIVVPDTVIYTGVGLNLTVIVWLFLLRRAAFWQRWSRAVRLAVSPVLVVVMTSAVLYLLVIEQPIGPQYPDVFGMVYHRWAEDSGVTKVRWRPPHPSPIRPLSIQPLPRKAAHDGQNPEGEDRLQPEFEQHRGRHGRVSHHRCRDDGALQPPRDIHRRHPGQAARATGRHRPRDGGRGKGRKAA